MISIRLSKDIETRLASLAEEEHITKTSLIKAALESYLSTHENKKSPFELGKDIFGLYGSGQTDLSKTYKNRLKEKWHEKHSH